MTIEEAPETLDPDGADGGATSESGEDAAVRRWFLSPAERGNPATAIDRLPPQTPGSWALGNSVRPLIHGATYFRRLHAQLCRLERGDRVYFTDWCGDADQRLLPNGSPIGEVLCDLVDAGVEVRGLLWRSHSDRLSFNAQENQRLGAELNQAGGQVLLDQRVRLFGSHHQKLFVVQHQDRPEQDVAFVGGIDLCHGRRDDALHEGDPQQPPMDRRYRGRAPWHDAALELRGPVVGDLLRTFVERWDDPTPLDHRTPYRALIQRRAHMPRHPEPLPESFPDPPRAGRHAVQVLRTYGCKRPGYPFAPQGERSVARAYSKVFELAHSLIYLEDQYLWSGLVAECLCRALRRSPGLRLIAVVPRYPDADGRLTGPANRLGQLEALRMLRGAGGDRVAVYDLENEAGTPIYVHAKLCIVDDLWLGCGSDNVNRRSWTSDSELACAVLDPQRDGREPADLSGVGDGARRLPRRLRMQVWGEHLGLAADDERLLDPVAGFELWRRRAADLERWHDPGRAGPRPPGRARPHRPDPVSRVQRLWSTPMYRWIYDPDGRPGAAKRSGGF
jgi:phosphatidylserine/phosphatidylglycerophosphate/cardiolipin synthase-like enzyme